MDDVEAAKVASIRESVGVEQSVLVAGCFERD
jgi:hypothetical protein